MNEAPDQTANRRRWAVYSSYLAALGMVVCFAAIFIQFIQWLVPGLDVRGMLLACALTALEAFISFWLVRHLPTAEKQPAFYRVTEFAILLVALKVFTELRAGPESFLTNVILWPVQFPFNILNGRYIFTLLPALASWQAANLLAGDLSLLGLDEASLPNERTKATPLRLDRTTLFRPWDVCGSLGRHSSSNGNSNSAAGRIQFRPGSRNLFCAWSGSGQPDEICQPGNHLVAGQTSGTGPGPAAGSCTVH